MEDKSNILYLAKKYGTPIFLIDLNKIIENLQRFRNAFKKEQNIIIGYSVKMFFDYLRTRKNSKKSNN